MKRRILSMALVGAMLLSAMSLTAFAAYSDVSESHWAGEAIEKWSGMGIVQGSEGQFRPGDAITRGEFAVIVDRMMRYQTQGQNVFTDLDQRYYTEAMLKAAYAKVFQGSGGLVRPKDFITRQEAFVVLSRVLGLEAVAGDRAELLGKLSFSDKDLVPDWALGAVVALSQRGVVQGTDGKVNPLSSISRAEVITLLNRAVADIISEGDTDTTGADGTVIVNAPGVVLKDMEIKGDLIVAQGVGSGDLTLENVTVDGRMIVRGGGENSIILTGTSHVQTVVLEKTDAGALRIVTKGEAQVEAVVVADGKDDVILTGAFGTATIAAEGIHIKVRDAKINEVKVTAPSVVLEVAKGSEIKTVAIESKNVAVGGEGKVETVQAKADGAKIDVVGAKVEVAQGVTGTTAGGKEIAGGETAVVKPPVSGGGDGGGSTTTYEYSFYLTLKKGANEMGTMLDTANAASAKLYDDVLVEMLGKSGYTDLVSGIMQGKLNALKGKTYTADGKTVEFGPNLEVIVNIGNGDVSGSELYGKLDSKIDAKKADLLTEAKAKIDYDDAATKAAYNVFAEEIKAGALLTPDGKLLAAGSYTSTLKKLLETGYKLVETAEPAAGHTEAELVDYLAGKMSTILGIDETQARAIVNTIRDRGGDKSASAKEWYDSVGQSVSVTVDNDMLDRVFTAYLPEAVGLDLITGSYTVTFEAKREAR
ncbi:MAG TPA: S-layer homology domain-containing protein [Pseudoflavonifractor sp.]|nr:S-layer homology domain-containing protein [Pseudoflavonifractor sp.]